MVFLSFLKDLQNMLLPLDMRYFSNKCFNLEIKKQWRQRCTKDCEAANKKTEEALQKKKKSRSS